MTDLHKIQRLIWSLIYKDADFENYNFVDETTVRVFEKPFYHIRFPTSYPTAIPCSSKFESKLNIWAGISYKGATNFAVMIMNFFIVFLIVKLKIFKENLDAELYQKKF